MKNCFIIINYNDYQTTLKLINNIKDYNIIDEIVVVDNASLKNDYDNLIKIQNEKITIFRSEKNNGYSAGINIGCKYLKEKYDNCNIIISNSDIIIKEEQDLKILIDDLKDYGVVAPLINEHGKINKGWKLPTPMKEVLINIPVIYKIFEKTIYYNNDYYNKKIVLVDVVSGCFFLTKLDILEKVNYFDENVFLYYEENILASKLKKQNIKTVIDTSVEIIHDHSVTIDKNIKSYKKYKILKQSQYYFETKYNNANIIEKVLLKLSIKIGTFIQYVRSKI